jgi:peroxiredoxin
MHGFLRGGELENAYDMLGAEYLTLRLAIHPVRNAVIHHRSQSDALVFGLAALVAALSGMRCHADNSTLATTPIANFTLNDYLGTTHSLADWRDKRAVVVTFLGTECPMAKLYGERLQEMADRYADQEVQFVGIDSNRQDSLEQIAHYAQTHKITFPLLKDPGNRVADQFCAERTPQVFVLDGERNVRYSGRIDDQFGVGFARGEAKREYLTIALEGVLSGNAVTEPMTAAIGCYIGRVEREPPHGELTYSKHIAPILNANCVKCHRSGEVAPFSLASYDDVVGWGETIVEVTQNGRMPPWHANPEYGHFANDARLSDANRQVIKRWVDNGMPEGNSADLPEPPKFVEGWQIDKPDLIYEMPAKYNVPAEGIVPYQYFELKEKPEKDLWIRAAEMRPGNSAVVHHLILFYVRPDQKKDRGEDALSQGIATFAPGMPAMNLPDGWALRVPAGSRLIFQAHYTPNGSPQTDRSRVGLVLADTRTVTHQLSRMSGENHEFEIPPGDNNYRAETTQRIGEDMLLYALTPHMHFRGKSFRFTAHYPDGTEEIILDVPRYDFNWQNSYQLAEPKLLPAKTEVQMEAHYDNSADNLSNPDPSKSVRWGDQTFEEMMIGTLSLTPAQPQPPTPPDKEGSVAP